MAVDLPMVGQDPGIDVPGFPRPVESIHQIEVTTFCNLKCRAYCPSPTLDKPIAEGGFDRAREFISREHFERALEWAVHFDKRGSQGELALTGIGEALMHPDFIDLVRIAREALPGNLITFSTNGILLTDEVCEQLAPYNPRIYVSLHRPERAKHAVDNARRWGLLDGMNTSFATDAFNWAGAMPDWEVTASEDVKCEFLRSGWCVVLADGRVATCCLDATGGSSVGHVNDEIGTLWLKPWKDPRTDTGCHNCYQQIVEPVIQNDSPHTR